MWQAAAFDLDGRNLSINATGSWNGVYARRIYGNLGKGKGKLDKERSKGDDAGMHRGEGKADLGPSGCSQDIILNAAMTEKQLGGDRMAARLSVCMPSTSTCMQLIDICSAGNESCQGRG